MDNTATNVTEFPTDNQPQLSEAFVARRDQINKRPDVQLDTHIQVMTKRLNEARARRIEIEAEVSVEREAASQTYQYHDRMLQQRATELQQMLDRVLKDIVSLREGYERVDARTADELRATLGQQDRIINGHRAMLAELNK